MRSYGCKEAQDGHVEAPRGRQHGDTKYVSRRGVTSDGPRTPLDDQRIDLPCREDR
jgi:hypothetical protein